METPARSLQALPALFTSHLMLPLLPSFDFSLDHYQLVLRSLAIFGTRLFLSCAHVPVFPGVYLQRDSVGGAGNVLGPGWMPRQGRECLPRLSCECLPGQGIAGVQVQLWLRYVIFIFALSSTLHKGRGTRALVGLGSCSCHGPMRGDRDIAQAAVTPVLAAVGCGSPRLRAAGIPVTGGGSGGAVPSSWLCSPPWRGV